MSNSKLAQQIADKVAKVKVEDDRIGGLYDYALKGAQAGLDHEPEFAPEGVQDDWRDDAENIGSNDTVHIDWSVVAPNGAEYIHTDFSLTATQARGILAYLSEQNRKDA